MNNHYEVMTFLLIKCSSWQSESARCFSPIIDGVSGALRAPVWLKVRMVFSGLCSGFCTNSFCYSLMPIQRPRRTVFLRALQTATSFSSNPRSVCISTPISVLKEQLRTSTSSTAVCYSNRSSVSVFVLCALFKAAVCSV